MTKTESFSEYKYINLETYRKSGKPVRTPVWFVLFDDLIYVITREKTGKVRRIKNRHDIK
ncbi:MAG: PPOX class F420-dependent oxidoreductase, partial [Candidatus Omnitrophica bacterium CG_4_9_14_0_2_um_filter_42_8]